MRSSPTSFTTTFLEGKDLRRSKTTSIENVGGHNQSFSARDGFLTKKTNRTEGRFYQRLMRRDLGLSKFAPKCFAVEDIADMGPKKNQAGRAKVTLEDLRQGYDKPLIYDIKLGRKTCSYRQLRAARTKPPEIVPKNFALSVFDAMSSSKKRGYRFVGSSATNESRLHLGTHPKKMIENISDNISRDDLLVIISQLDELLAYLRSEEGRRFELIGASVMIIAESDTKTIDAGCAALPLVKLIDFAHSTMTVEPRSLSLDNGVFLSPKRKKTYQKKLRDGVARLADDLRSMLITPS